MRRALRLFPAVVLLAISAGAPFGWAQPFQAERFLGFEIGEERRYVLGPETIRERGIWSIHLEEVFVTDGEPEGQFALTHEWAAPPVIGDPVLGQIRNVKSDGFIRVNAYGFPLVIQFQTTRHMAGMGDQAYTIDFRIDEEDHRRYDKRTTVLGERWYQNVPIRRHDTVDFDAPEGLFAFLPNAPGCLNSPVQRYDQAGGTFLQPRSAGSSTGSPVSMPNTVKVTDNSDCEESMFAHLGLLSLAMPALWEAQGEREYLFFTPIGPEGEPTTRVSGGGGGVSTPYGPGAIGTGRRPNLPSPYSRLEGDSLSPSTYHETETLKFIERVSVQIGSRTTDVWLIEMSNGYGPLYVDDDGGVIRIDLRPGGDEPERYIRMLWPSEY